jgi:hypothetical protein
LELELPGFVLCDASSDPADRRFMFPAAYHLTKFLIPPGKEILGRREY